MGFFHWTTEFPTLCHCILCQDTHHPEYIAIHSYLPWPTTTQVTSVPNHWLVTESSWLTEYSQDNGATSYFLNTLRPRQNGLCLKYIPPPPGWFVVCLLWVFWRKSNVGLQCDMLMNHNCHLDALSWYRLPHYNEIKIYIKYSMICATWWQTNIALSNKLHWLPGNWGNQEVILYHNPGCIPVGFHHAVNQ